MATIHLATTVKNAMLLPLADAINAGSAGGTITIYDGAMPSLPSVAPTTQKVLGVLTFADPCGTVATGALSITNITQDNAADNGGIATWARIADSSGVAVADIDVSNTGGGGVLQLNTTNIVKDGPILITSITFSL